MRKKTIFLYLGVNLISLLQVEFTSVAIVSIVLLILIGDT